MSVGRVIRIVLIGMFAFAVIYLLMFKLISLIVNPSSDSLFDIILVTLFVAGGLSFYLIFVNAVVIIGILISLKRKDKEARYAFLIMALVTLITTLYFILS